MVTTEQDFKIFVKECEYWLNLLNLHSVRVEFQHDSELQDVWGTMSYDSAASLAIITLSKKLSGRYTPEQKLYQIKDTALHEVLELLLAPLRIEATKSAILLKNGILIDDVDNQVHQIIHRIISIIEHFNGTRTSDPTPERASGGKPEKKNRGVSKGPRK